MSLVLLLLLLLLLFHSIFPEQPCTFHVPYFMIPFSCWGRLLVFLSVFRSFLRSSQSDKPCFLRGYYFSSSSFSTSFEEGLQVLSWHSRIKNMFKYLKTLENRQTMSFPMTSNHTQSTSNIYTLTENQFSERMLFKCCELIYLLPSLLCKVLGCLL